MTHIGFWSAAKAHPDRIAIVDPEGGTLTFRELQSRANQLVHALREMGLQRGDGIAILLPNCAEFIVSVLAAGQAGLYYTPLNHNLVASEIAYILDNSDAKAFIAHERFGDKARAAIGEADIPSLNTLAVGEIDGFDGFTSVVDRQPTTAPEDRAAGSMMSYTSGTTGRPKGVRRPLSGMSPECQDKLTAPMNMLAVFGLGAAGKNAHLCVSPLYHNAPGGYALFALQLGHTLVLTAKFDAEEFLALVEKHRITSTQMVPIQFYRLLKLPEATRKKYDVSSLRVISHAGAPCPADVKRRMMDWFGPVVYEYYSSGEGVGGTLVTPSEALERPGTVGRPFLPGAVIKILDESGNEVPRGEVGAVYSTLPGGGASFSYHKDESKSASSRHGDLFTAGDYGRMDEDGYLYLVSRRTDLILSGGVNIYPAEVETILLEHPDIADAAVFGIPNEEWGEEVKAVVQLAVGVTASPDLADEIQKFCRERSAAFKVPKSVDFMDELPRDPNGKMYKRSLRDPYWVNATVGAK